MALIEGRFYTGSMTDKRHEADGLALYMRRIVSSGVMELGTNLQITAGTGKVSVNYGDAMIDGYLFRIRDNGAGLLTLTVVSGTRKDRVVIRKDKAAKNVGIYIKQGTTSPPELENTADVSEISLAQLDVSGTTITVTDERSAARVEMDAITVGGKTLEEIIAQAVAESKLAAHPVGDVYISENSTSPADLFGGTWERLKDRFLLAAGDTYAAGTTGGAATHHHTTSILGGGYETNKAGCHFIGASATDGVANTAYQSSDASNLPPFAAVYVWKRTA